MSLACNILLDEEMVKLQELLDHRETDLSAPPSHPPALQCSRILNVMNTACELLDSL